MKDKSDNSGNEQDHVKAMSSLVSDKIVGKQSNILLKSQLEMVSITTVQDWTTKYTRTRTTVTSVISLNSCNFHQIT